ncbi:hypothetical protein EXIGLDRAFT_677825 [Exidia glandulosa HHB12029]|uniref:Uncharacterized protein n=1 Tax=Exidia glandulosa HHB12029 TaxID=1314781 RepID=A0A165FX54_EXIGL|nr:hypothetical protein EXIGLDRAFT_677825 [Exidia glandulosa HHB12029]
MERCPCGRTLYADMVVSHRARCPTYNAHEASTAAAGQAALLQQINERAKKRVAPVPPPGEPQSKKKKLPPWLQSRRAPSPPPAPAPAPASSSSSEMHARSQETTVSDNIDRGYSDDFDAPYEEFENSFGLDKDREEHAEDGVGVPLPQPSAEDDTEDDTRPGPYNLRRRPARVPNLMPQRLEPLEEVSIDPDPTPAESNEQGVKGPAPEKVRTQPNIFGLWKEYDYRPSSDPEKFGDATDCLAPKLRSPPAQPSVRPHDNLVQCRSHELLLEWQSSGTGEKCFEDTERLVNVLRHPDFNQHDFADNSWAKAFRALGASLDGNDDWYNPEVHVDIPLLKQFRAENDGAPSIELILKGFRHRKLCGLMRYLLENDPSCANWTFEPYRVFVTREDGTTERVYGQVYWSDEMIEEHANVQKLFIPESRGGRLPRCIIVFMFGSDAMALSSFGTASAWPGYTMFGNQDKYIRSKPSANAVHHIAQFDKLPDAVQDFIKSRTNGKAAKRALLTFCKRESIHKSWEILLDDEFLQAYEFGMIINCVDGVRRLCFPRILTYSADYPERALIACTKDKGTCLCPRCLISKPLVPKLGLHADMQRRQSKARIDDENRQRKVRLARDLIFKHGIAVDSTALDPLLKDQSLTPITNAFSKRLAPLGFNFFKIFVCDILHDWEKGAFEMILIHMLRVLNTFDKNLLPELDERFRLIGTFGRTTIRKFHNNVSELKRLAARDFEDILQCAIPPFDRLAPEASDLDDLFMDLLFVSADWHAASKLRMHTESSVNGIDLATRQLGTGIRKLKDDTDGLQAKELPRETRARQRRYDTIAAVSGNRAAPATAQTRQLNLEIPKMHLLGYVSTDIRRIGTTDNYDTRLVESAHRRIKRAFRVTNHHNEAAQLTAIERRRGRLSLLAATAPPPPPPPPSVPGRRARKPIRPASSEDVPPSTQPADQYNISKDQRFAVDISHFTARDLDDPATKNFFPQLKSHLLERLGFPYDMPDDRFSEGAQRKVTIVNGKLYLHRTLRLNYTTYDLRRDQDSINPRTDHRDIMFLSEDDRRNAHPYWYARVLNIFHLYVQRVDRPREPPQRVDVLWIRWFGEDTQWRDGWARRRLPRVGFVPDTDPDAFGFLDPATVIRGCHLMPAVAEGRRSDLLPYDRSTARRDGEVDDWTNFYVGIFVDRDMWYRYRGGGVGHRFTLPTRPNAWFPLRPARSRQPQPEENAPAPQEPPPEPAPEPEPEPAPLHEASIEDLHQQAEELAAVESRGTLASYSFEDDDDDEEDGDWEPEGGEAMDGSFDGPVDSSDDELGYDLDDEDANIDDEL